MDGRGEPSVGLVSGRPQTPGGAWDSVGGTAQAGRVPAGLRQSRKFWRKVVFRARVGVFALLALAMAGPAIHARLR
jgi:hypothetical protein